MLLHEDKSEYVVLCNGYRIITLVFSTIVYIVVYLNEREGEFVWEIVIGMILSFLLSSRLHAKLSHREPWMHILFYLEIFSYGIFLVLSGGFSSPYLWYYVSTMLSILTIEKYGSFLVAIIWGMICSVSGNIKNGISYQELNVAFGMIMVVGGFYLLNIYIKKLESKKQLLHNSNSKLEKEKEVSENAFFQLMGLYETFNIFAMNNPDKILKALAELLRKFVAPSGCLLLKFDSSGMIEKFAYSGIDEILARQIMDKYNRELFNKAGYELIFHDSDSEYELRMVGNTVLYRGAFIRGKQDMGKANEEFYWNLIEIIFSNMDIYSQMERFITMEEQNRIANELHDTVIQKLFGIACNLKVTEMKIGDMNREEQQQYLSGIKKSVEMTMSELRESIYGRSFIKTVDSFIDMMQQYMEDAQNLSEVCIRLSLDKNAEYMSPAQKVAVYRVSCEAVNNAIRHGDAHNISIDLSIDNETIKLFIEDDGNGIQKHKKGLYEGNGVRNMRSIAALLKGSLSMAKGRDEHGMLICLSLPR